MKRFYRDVTVDHVDGGWQVALDGRPIRTQLGNPQVVPTSVMASAMKEEWASQGEKMDPATFLFRDHADFAIDVVRPGRAEAIAKLLAFAETDTLCYRADPADALFKEQQDRWEPLLKHLERTHGIRFHRISGVMHRAQPAETLARLRAHLESLDDFALAGLTAMASLSASLATALLASDAAVNDAQSLWNDANLEEQWQASRWGREAEAEAVRKRRWQDFSTAQVFVTLAQSAD